MFALYPPLLMFSGALLIVMAALPWQTPGRRVISGIFGAGFLGYGFYLEFLFSGGHYIVFYYAFIVPILMIFQTVKGYQAWQARKAQGPALFPGAQFAAPPQFGAPQQFAPPQQFGAPPPPAQQFGPPAQQFAPPAQQFPAQQPPGSAQPQ